MCLPIFEWYLNRHVIQSMPIVVLCCDFKNIWVGLKRLSSGTNTVCLWNSDPGEAMFLPCVGSRCVMGDKEAESYRKLRLEMKSWFSCSLTPAYELLLRGSWFPPYHTIWKFQPSLKDVKYPPSHFYFLSYQASSSWMSVTWNQKNPDKWELHSNLFVTETLVFYRSQAAYHQSI